MLIGIIDYGISNLTSVDNAFAALNAERMFVKNKEDFYKCSHLVLPGVGTFSKGMERLVELDFVATIKKEVQKGKPFLGICLGMQLLAALGTEVTLTKGLDLISGTVKKISDLDSIRLPHMGWNNVEIIKKSLLWKNIDNGTDFYFVHSYAFDDITSCFVSALSEYGSKIVVGIEKDNIFGVQFHPEKSQACGLKILKNFMEIC